MLAPVAMLGATQHEVTLQYTLPNAYSGPIEVPVKKDMLPSSFFDALRPDGAGLTAHAVNGDRLPLHLKKCKPAEIHHLGTISPAWNTVSYPAAWYSEAENITIRTRYMWFYEIWVDRYDHTAEKWLDPVFVGNGYPGVSNNQWDNHAAPSIAQAEDGTWYVGGGGHSTSISIWKSVDSGATWTLVTTYSYNYPSGYTYSQFAVVGNDLLLFTREQEIGYMHWWVSVWSQSEFVAKTRLIEGTSMPTMYYSSKDFSGWYIGASRPHGNDVHLCVGTTEDYVGVGDSLAQNQLHIILNCTLDGNGHVSSWRVRDLTGSTLKADNTAVRWNDIANTATWLCGYPGSSAALNASSATTTWAPWRHVFGLGIDDDGNPHRAIVENQGNASKLWYAKWNGSSWAVDPVVDTGLSSRFKPSNVIPSTDGSCQILCGDVPDNVIYNRSAAGQWTKQVIADSIGYDRTYHKANTPSLVENGREEMQYVGSVTPFVSNGSGSNFGGLPHYALSSTFLPFRSRQFSAWVRATAVSGSVTVKLVIDGFEPQPAANEAFGAYSVWQDWDAVALLEDEGFIAQIYGSNALPSEGVKNYAPSQSPAQFYPDSGQPVMMSPRGFSTVRANSANVLSTSYYGSEAGSWSFKIPTPTTAPFVVAVAGEKGWRGQTDGIYAGAYFSNSGGYRFQLSLRNDAAGGGPRAQNYATTGSSFVSVAQTGVEDPKAAVSVCDGTSVVLSTDGAAVASDNMSAGAFNPASLTVGYPNQVDTGATMVKYYGECALVAIANGVTLSEWTTNGRAQATSFVFSKRHDTDWVLES